MPLAQLPLRRHRAARWSKCCVGATLLLSGAVLPGPAPLRAQADLRPAARAYETVVGEDWTRYRDLDQLRGSRRFSWLEEGDVYRYVRLVPDATFGQVARIVFPVNHGGPGPAPRIIHRLPRTLDRMWYRWRMRYSPGWTAAGPDPAGHNNSYKIAFWGWSGYEGRGEVLLAHTDDYVVGITVKERGAAQALRQTVRLLPGSAPSLGEAGADFVDGEWHEFVVFYEAAGPTTLRQRWWRRRLTRDGRASPSAWTYVGAEYTGAPAPPVDRVELGINKNKNTPVEQYIDWGPYEVVDGTRHPNPFGMPLSP